MSNFPSVHYLPHKLHASLPGLSFAEAESETPEVGWNQSQEAERLHAISLLPLHERHLDKNEASSQPIEVRKNMPIFMGVGVFSSASSYLKAPRT
jgi:hypothetical protein